MPVDYQKTSGTVQGYTTDRGKATLITEPVIGIVKNNVDATHSGRIEVYIATFGGTDPDNKDNWTPVDYLSPFMGVVSPGGAPDEGPDRNGWGKFVGNPQSYGFWASAPDIGTQVVCLFINGLKDQGYYIGCIPQIGMLQMTPAIGASSLVVPNETEATSYGGADRLPTTEINYSNPAIKDSGKIYSEAKPIHSYQAAILANQGLIRDPVRGVVSSSAQRESPSRVFGWSTPGGPIYEGGYTNATIASAVESGDTKKLQIVGRTGGHTFVMDDGTLDGQDQLVRLRTSGGHQILMSDSGQTLFIMHSNGQSWVELGKEGTVDVFSTNSVNVRTQGDINLHADRDININAGRKIQMRSGSLAVESDGDIDFRAAGNFKGYSIGNYTFRADNAISISSGSDASIAAGGIAWVNGSQVNLNSGSASITAESVPPLNRVSHIDTTWSQSVGWMYPSPQPLLSIVNRAPTHQPWSAAGAGVDVTVDPQAAASSGVETTPAADAANASAPAIPNAQVDMAEIAAAPDSAINVATLSSPGVSALTAQMAVNAQSLTGEQLALAGIISTVSGLTVNQLDAAGAIKPGSGALATELIRRGMSPERALSGSMAGCGRFENSQSVVNNSRAQATILQELMSDSARQLISRGILTGRESGAQSGGLIMAATAVGVPLLASYLNNTDTTPSINTTANGAIGGAVGTISENISAGKLAGGIDGGVGSLAGLSSSISGLTSGLGGISNPLTGVQNALRSAFGAVEASYGSLKSGEPNALGPQNPLNAQPSAVTEASNQLDRAQLEILASQEALLEAKRDYRLSATPENEQRIQEAENALSVAQQKQAQATSSFLGAMPGALSFAAEGRRARGNTSRRGGNLGGAFGGLGRNVNLGRLPGLLGIAFPRNIPGLPQIRLPVPNVPGFPGGLPGIPRLPGLPRGIPTTRQPGPNTRRRPGGWESRPPTTTIPDGTGVPSPQTSDPIEIPPELFPADDFSGEDGTSTFENNTDDNFGFNQWKTLDGDIPNSRNTGLNSLPGGQSSLYSVVNGGNSDSANPVSQILNTVTTAFPDVGADLAATTTEGSISDPYPGLDGDLIGGTFGTIDEVGNIENNPAPIQNPTTGSGGVSSPPMQDGNGPPGTIYRPRGGRTGPPLNRPIRVPGIPRIPGIPDIPGLPGLGRGRIGNIGVILGGNGYRRGSRSGGTPRRNSPLSAGLIAQLQATLSAIVGQVGAPRSPVAATGTFNSSALIAKSGQLLGDPKIPVPVFASPSSSAPAMDRINQIQQEQTAALDAVKEAESRVSNAKLNLSLTQRQFGNTNNQESLEALTLATEQLRQEEDRLFSAQQNYATLVSQNS